MSSSSEATSSASAFSAPFETKPVSASSVSALNTSKLKKSSSNPEWSSFVPSGEAEEETRESPTNSFSSPSESTDGSRSPVTPSSNRSPSLDPLDFSPASELSSLSTYVISESSSSEESCPKLSAVEVIPYSV